MAETIHDDYLGCLGFRDAPFRLSPDPAFFYPARPHIAAKEALKYGIGRGEGFMVLTGPPGTGKTLLLKLLLQEIGTQKVPVLVLTPAVDPPGLLRLILDDMGCDADGEDLGTLLRRFQTRLLELAGQGRELLIIVDEAQDLPVETLEQLRLLSNVETSSRKLLQIVLMGQPELEGLLEDPRLRQLSQRVVVQERLRPLTRAETEEYIAFRLARAGRADLKPSQRAVGRIQRATSGIPRLINRLMDRSLLMVAASGSHKIGAEHIARARETLPEPCQGGLFAFMRRMLPALPIFFLNP
ncbi:MAG: AAA family ATPase [Deltaproteobacteria bacterium]